MTMRDSEWSSSGLGTTEYARSELAKPTALHSMSASHAPIIRCTMLLPKLRTSIVSALRPASARVNITSRGPSHTSYSWIIRHSGHPQPRSPRRVGYSGGDNDGQKRYAHHQHNPEHDEDQSSGVSWTDLKVQAVCVTIFLGGFTAWLVASTRKDRARWQDDDEPRRKTVERKRV